MSLQLFPPFVARSQLTVDVKGKIRQTDHIEGMQRRAGDTFALPGFYRAVTSNTLLEYGVQATLPPRIETFDYGDDCIRIRTDTDSNFFSPQKCALSRDQFLVFRKMAWVISSKCLAGNVV